MSGDDTFETDQGQRTFNRIFATQIGFPDARYVLVCHECNTALKRERDSAVVKRARDDDRSQPCSCGGEYELVRDAKS